MSAIYGGFDGYGDTDVLSMFTTPPPPKSQVQVQQLRRSSTSTSQNPEAGGTVANPVQDRINALEEERRAALAQQEKAYAKPDYSSYEKMVQQKQQDRKGGLLLALASQAAGKDYAPFQAHYLKQAASASDPTKVTGGLITSSGFQEDVGYAQELEAKRIDARLKQIDQQLQQNLSMQERARLQEEKIQSEKQLRMMIGAISASKQPAGQIVTDAEGNSTLVDLRTGEKKPLGKIGSGKGGETGSKLSGEERSAQGYLSRMRAAEAKMKEEAVDAQRPGLAEFVGGFIPGIGPEVSNFARSGTRQQVYQAQEDWVRAKLRKESGAVIGDEEMRREIRTYFPLMSDTPEVVKQKAEARREAERQMEIMGAVDKRDVVTNPGHQRTGGGAGTAAPTGTNPRTSQYYGD